MSLTDAFDKLQTAVNADPKVVAEARRRRNAFRKVFDGESDVVTTHASGSLARGSQIAPIKDVDVLVVYEETQHPDWGQPGESADVALEYTRGRIKDLLTDPGPGDEVDAVRLTKVRDHAVTCWLDEPDDEDAFTVDVVPALKRADGGFWIPEKPSSAWIPTDPIYLVNCVLNAHEESQRTFVPLLRDLKRWSRDNGKVIKGLTMEVLALDHLPRDLARHDALEEFFVAAADAVFQPIVDPAGLCGEIQPDLDRDNASKLLREAGDFAWRANRAAGRDDFKSAKCLWRKVFGPIFPEPPGGCGGNNRPGGVPPVVVPVPQRPVQDLQQG